MAVEIPLSRGLVALVDDEDAEWLGRWRWTAHISRDAKPKIYAARCRRKGDDFDSALMHRMIMRAPRGVLVDHRSLDTLDNRRGNLRLASHSQNNCNIALRSDNTTGFKGVTRAGARFCAKIWFNNVGRHLGTFDTAEEAYAAYLKASAELHGEFARVA